MKTVEFIENKSIGMEAYNCGCNFSSNKYCRINHSGTYVLLSDAEANKRALVEALEAIEEGCSFPENEVQKACRDRARAALAKGE